MGDDLTFAREFTAMAAEGLDLVLSMDDRTAPEAQHIVTNMTTRIQRGAKRLRARHLYRAAQDVFIAMDAPNMSSDAMDDRLHNLSELLRCYETGLADLDAQTAELTAPKIEAEIISLPEHRSEYDRARETLESLLTLANPQDADALSRLMRAPVQAEIAAKPASILSFPAESSAAMSVDVETDMSQDIPSKRPRPAELPAEALWSLDSLMRDVVSDALLIARQSGKTISVSYDMGEASVSETAATDIRARLGKALSQIIREHLPENKIGHLDINLAGETLHVVAAGVTALRVPLRAPQRALDERAADAAPTPRRMITQDTETDLRDQLSRLMEGGV